VAAFVAAFAGMDAVGALLHGVFVLPTRRLVTAAGGHLPLHLTAGVLVPIGLLTLERRLGPAGRRRLAVATGVAGVTVLVWAAIPGVYRAAWFSLQVVVPVAVVAGALIAYRSASHMGVTGRVRLLTPVLWTAALTSLLQFPLAGPIYFAHIAPMGVLAAVAAMGALRREAPTGPVGQGSTGGARAVAGSTAEAWATVGYPVLLTVTAFYVAFLVAGPNRAGYFGPPSGSELVRLPLERGHLRVSSATAQEYGRLTTALRELSRSETIYVTPDAPEVYFLSGLRNPTRTLFEIFDEPGVTRSILDALELHEVNVVVLNTGADFSTPPPGVVTELERRYPRAARIGRFVVRWR
jgi:hypothetical protein